MSRKVTNNLLHTIFATKEFKGEQQPPDLPYYSKFLKTTFPDGVSFNETRAGHGRFIFRHSKELLDNRRKKKPDKYSDYAYLVVEPESFSAQPFVSDAVKEKIDRNFFSIAADEKSETHVLICLPPGAKANLQGNNTVKEIRHNGQILCDNTEVTRILFELYNYFSTRMKTRNECHKAGYFSDCRKNTSDYECFQNCPEPNSAV